MKKTQCPHCFTVYQISEQQLLKSRGNVRCGNCHERFKAQLIKSADVLLDESPIDSNDLFAPPAQNQFTKDLELETRQKDGSRNRKEPSLNDNSPELGLELPSKDNSRTDVPLVKEPEAPSFDLEFGMEKPASDRDLIDEIDRIIAEQFNELESSNYDSNTGSNESHKALLKELAKDPLLAEGAVVEEQVGEGSQSGSKSTVSKFDEPLQDLVDSTPKRTRRDVPAIDWQSETEFDDDISTSITTDDLFIVDEYSEPSTDDDFVPRKSKSIGRIVTSIFACGLLLVGLLVLVYQIWVMPSSPLRDNTPVQTALNSAFNPLLDWLETHNVVLPRPNQLKGISLVSARSEPHANRASTTLLRVSLLNQSAVATALPWLELTLSDSNGRTVSRRALNPIDYLHNNNSSDEIGPHELKKITIELLAFPDQVSGFELRVLQNAPSKIIN